jgi:hypothetical protein
MLRKRRFQVANGNRFEIRVEDQPPGTTRSAATSRLHCTNLPSTSDLAIYRTARNTSGPKTIPEAISVKDPLIPRPT